MKASFGLQLSDSFTFSVSYAAVIQALLGIQNLNNKELTNIILIVVVKCRRQRANLPIIFTRGQKRGTESIQKAKNHSEVITLLLQHYTGRNSLRTQQTKQQTYGQRLH